MGTSLTLKEKQGSLVEYFESRKPDFASLMESADQVDRFMRVMKNALIRDPQIAEASATSVFLECQKCAQDGLVLDGREAVLTRFKTNRREKVGNAWKDNWVMEVVYVPMIRGKQKIVSQSPQIADWHTGLVYEKEYEAGMFDYEAGDTPRLKHKPLLVGERGPVVIAYSVVRLRSGVVKIEVMTRGQLDRIKSRTKSKKQDGTITGPWATDEEEMFRKTVAHRHFKSLPLGDKVEQVFNRDAAMYDRPMNEIEEMPEVERPKAVANKRKASAKDKLAAAAGKEKPLEGEIITADGEVIDNADKSQADDGDSDNNEGDFDAGRDEF